MDPDEVEAVRAVVGDEAAVEVERSADVVALVVRFARPSVVLQPTLRVRCVVPPPSAIAVRPTLELSHFPLAEEARKELRDALDATVDEALRHDEPYLIVLVEQAREALQGAASDYVVAPSPGSDDAATLTLPPGPATADLSLVSGPPPRWRSFALHTVRKSTFQAHIVYPFHDHKECPSLSRS